MMKIQRLAAPQCLVENAQAWGEEYQSSGNWSWRTYQGTPTKELLLPPLRQMTSNHCSFCDGYVQNATGDTIEHFRPKAKFPLLAYEWTNLFYCCHRCQGVKGSKFDEALLRPDADDYAFISYFIYDSLTGEVSPNPGCSEEDQSRANVTINLYGLNRFDRPEARKRAFEMSRDANLDDRPYRFIF